MISEKFNNRYERQIKLPEFGREAQLKLLDAGVLVVGAGGLGCPVLQYLAGAGIGRIGIMDDDTVSLSDLHRQVLYSEDDVGSLKAERAGIFLSRLNPDIRIDVYPERFTNKNAFNILRNYDVIVDATDNISSRYMINDACVLMNKPVIYGAISKFEGHLAVFNAVSGNHQKRTANYRDLFPGMPKEGDIPSCEEAGVMGILPGIIGSMQANEALKLISGIGQPLINKLLNYNALTNRMHEFEISLREEIPFLIPRDQKAYMNTDYNWLCSSGIQTEYEIDYRTLEKFIEEGSLSIVDVRDPDEAPRIDWTPHLRIPLADLKSATKKLTHHKMVLVCQTGQRSLSGVKILNDMFDGSREIYSLKGGLKQWAESRRNER